jgi:hypothetical protein
MALVLKDRVLENSTSTGTGSFTLTGAQTGYQSFNVIGNGNTTYYTIQGKNPDGTLTGEWEVGEGTWSTGNTLARDTVLSNSLGTTALINFSAGDKDVFVTYPSEKAIYEDASGNVGIGVAAGAGLTVGGGSLSARGVLTSASALSEHQTSKAVFEFSANNTTTIRSYGALAGTGQIAFNTGGGGNSTDAERMRINASGNVSIGTSASQAPLQIAKDGIASGAGWTSVLKATDSSNNKGFDFGYDASSQTSIVVANTSSSASNLAFWTYTGAAWGERMRIHASGGVSIGNTTDSGASNLSVAGAIVSTRITPRVSTTASSATPTINTDNTDQFGLTAQTVDITSFTTNLSGTPTNGQKLWIYIVGTAARAITWGASFESSTATLPTTTVSTNRLDVGFVWNAATSKWRCVAVA